MLSRKRDYQYIQAPEAVWDAATNLPDAEHSVADIPTRFHGQFADCMEMYAGATTVAEYLNAHQGWFCRCAQPMKVELVGENGYALTIGRFGALGYDVEPKVGLELLPPDEGIYRIKTIAIPDYVAPGYDVDFKAVMQLVEQPASSFEQYTGEITRVEWNLDLAVYIHFPKFIHRLPKSMVQTTGDRVLNQVVRQVSRRLTYKVQEDFHKSLGLPFPFKSKRAHKEAREV
jgi:hypothetical protein